MNKLVLTMLATAALSLPAVAQNQPQQPGQGQQPSQATQRQNSSQSQAKTQSQAQQKSAQNRTISPSRLNTQQIRQVQQALNQKGDDAGRVDGKFGRETRTALEKFQRQQGMQANGKLDQQTLSALGVQVAQSSRQPSQTTGAGRRQDRSYAPQNSMRSGGQNGRRQK